MVGVSAFPATRNLNQQVLSILMLEDCFMLAVTWTPHILPNFMKTFNTNVGYEFLFLMIWKHGYETNTMESLQNGQSWKLDSIRFCFKNLHGFIIGLFILFFLLYVMKMKVLCIIIFNFFPLHVFININFYVNFIYFYIYKIKLLEDSYVLDLLSFLTIWSWASFLFLILTFWSLVNRSYEWKSYKKKNNYYLYYRYRFLQI